ncbi:MAG TPA: Crp/Fnr family transcriptional regulator [Gemmatimonadaceae bacterium]|nr:Crp/Fnr family transcriptional regulator [Gemmatimonadaceae bacterium]
MSNYHMTDGETRNQLLDSLTPRGRETLLKQSVEKRFSTGEILWSAGDQSQGITLVLEGRVRVVRGRGGRQLVIHSGEPGATLGEVPFFTGGVYPATAIAAEPTRCLLLTHAAVTRAMEADPGLAFFFLKRLSSRVHNLVERVDQLTVSSVQTRLARFIVHRHETSATNRRSRSGRGERVTFSLGMTQSALAEELGTVREVVVRSLRGLRQLGAIESAGDGKYRISNRPILEQLAELAP